MIAADKHILVAMFLNGKSLAFLNGIIIHYLASSIFKEQVN